MIAEGCGCVPVAAAAAEQAARVDKWRDVCEQFYFQQDPTAKRVLDYFESCKLDQVVIEAKSDGESPEDPAFAQLVTFLGLRKCAVNEHTQLYDQTIEVLERVQDQVRGSYHTYRANAQYQAFDTHVNQMQGTNYEVVCSANDGRDRLVLRVQQSYMRSASNQALMEKNTEAFIKTHLPNVGAHPFIAGLAEVLRWNLESSTVVGWQLSDAVFVESGGPAFSGAALSFLVGVLNFGHIVVGAERDAASQSQPLNPLVQSRTWLLDAYMSDHDIRQLLRLFPASRKLEARPTGSKCTSEIDRMNIHGAHDERQPFFDRWCVLL